MVMDYNDAERERERERESEREKDERERRHSGEDIHSRHTIMHSSEPKFDLKWKWDGNEVVQN